jgi:hypothetical protein
MNIHTNFSYEIPQSSGVDQHRNRRVLHMDSLTESIWKIFAGFLRISFPRFMFPESRFPELCFPESHFPKLRFSESHFPVVTNRYFFFEKKWNKKNDFLRVFLICSLIFTLSI